jgi:RNA polymerase sigma-70 factor (ECF subfamily)
MDKIAVFNISSLGTPDLDSNQDALASLLAKAQKGEQAAFGEIYNLYFKKIYQFIYYRVSHKEIAEDLAEEVFLKAFTKLSSISQNSAFLGWLYQIARFQVIDYYREKKSTVALEEIENTLEYEANVVDFVNLQQQQKVLLKLIKELSPEQQIVLKLKFFEDLENIEIAAVMDKTEGAIRVIQHRAIAKLQELINNTGQHG